MSPHWDSFNNVSRTTPTLRVLTAGALVLLFSGPVFADTVELPAKVQIIDDEGNILLIPKTSGFWTDRQVVNGCLACDELVKVCTDKRTECEKARVKETQKDHSNEKIFGLAGAALLVGVLIGVLAGGR